MTIKHLFPVAKPTLDLNFAAERALDPRITFTRSSTGTYVDENGIVRTAQDDEPRFDHDPETGESLGLLIEESRTNMITYSEDLDDTSWFKFNLDVTNSVMDSPKGSSSVSLVETTGTSSNLVSAQYLVLTIGNTYTLSTFVKKGNNQWVRLCHVTGNGTGCWFDLDNGEIGTINSEGATMTAYPNGWYRITNTFVATETGPQSNVGGVPQIAFLGICDGDGNNSTSTGQNVYVWGMQVEAGSFPSSCIPTAGATATRAADTASITGTNFSSWYNPSESTWYVEGDQLGLNANGDQATIQSIFADRYANIAAQRRTAKSWRGRQGTTEVVPTFTTPNTPKGSTVKVTYAIDGTNAKMCIEGVLSATGTLAAYPQTTELSLGRDSANGNPWVGHICRIAYYSRRLTDAQLKALTS